MTHLLRLEPKWIVVLDESDEEIMVDRQHFETYFGIEDEYWDYATRLNDTEFQFQTSRYLNQHQTLNTIEGLKIPIT